MIKGQYFTITVESSFYAQIQRQTWTRTLGVEIQLCDLLDNSREAPITQSQVRLLTGWPKEDVRRWFSELLSSGAFVDDETINVQRWRLSRDVPSGREEMKKLIPPIGSKLLNRKQVALLEKATRPEPTADIDESVFPDWNCKLSLPGIVEDDDLFAVFSRP